MGEPVDDVDFHGVIFTQGFVVPTADPRLIRRAKADDRTTITIRHGCRAQHPIAQVTMSAVLLGATGFAGVMQYRWLVNDSTVSIMLLAIAGFTGITGAWLLFDAFRRGWYCVVASGGKQTKFAFEGRPDAAALDELAVALRERFGWDVARD